jgi:hypothetical protein
MFERWDSFYLLTGGASGAIIGLLFVVATLMKGDDPNTLRRAAGAYLSPIVFHMSMVLGVSAFATAPHVAPALQGFVLGACALAGIARAFLVIYSLGLARKVTASHWSDIWWYGYAALAAYLPLAAAAPAAWLAPKLAADLAATGLLAVLFVAIRNAWDLVTWISLNLGKQDQPTIEGGKT